MEHSPEAYYLRSKRRKTNHGRDVITANYPTASSRHKRKNPIMHIPFEVLQNILKFISYQELSDGIRFVNRKFKMAAEDLLNKSFKSLKKRIHELSALTFQAIQATADDMEVKCLCRLLNLLDILQFQQSVIMATVWRYVYNVFYRTSRSCMYAGLLLDIFELLLEKCILYPYLVYGPAVVRDYAIPDEMKHLIQLTKSFCLHFDKTIEEQTKNALTVSGTKIVDLLDCATFATKTVVYERTTVTGTFSAKYSYFLHNAWFIAFGIPPEKQMTLNQKQRLMHMRIRRILLAHTEMFMQQSQYEREHLLRASPDLRKPSIVAYTGYGDVHDTFFYYGAMNDQAYVQKFHLQDEELNDEEDVEDELHLEEILQAQGLLADEEEGGQAANEEEFGAVPHLGLDIDVIVDCPVAYAPMNYVQENVEAVKRMEGGAGGMFEIVVEFNCPGAFYPRLPKIHSYQKKISTRFVA